MPRLSIRIPTPSTGGCVPSLPGSLYRRNDDVSEAGPFKGRQGVTYVTFSSSKLCDGALPARLAVVQPEDIDMDEDADEKEVENQSRQTKKG